MSIIRRSHLNGSSVPNFYAISGEREPIYWPDPAFNRGAPARFWRAPPNYNAGWIQEFSSFGGSSIAPTFVPGAREAVLVLALILGYLARPMAQPGGVPPIQEWEPQLPPGTPGTVIGEPIKYGLF